MAAPTLSQAGIPVKYVPTPGAADDVSGGTPLFTTDPPGSEGLFGEFTFGDILGVTGFTSYVTTSLAGFDFETTSLTNINFPNLVSIDPSNTQGGYLSFEYTRDVVISAPKLVSIGGNLDFSYSVDATCTLPLLASVGSAVAAAFSNSLTLTVPLLASVSAFTVQSSTGATVSAPLLSLIEFFSTAHSTGAVLNFPALAVISGAVFLDNAINLTLDLPSLVTTADGITASNTIFSVFNFPSWVPTASKYYRFDGCNLNVVMVEQILRRCVLANANALALLDLSGGINAGKASLSPQGQSDATQMSTWLGANFVINP